MSSGGRGEQALRTEELLPRTRRGVSHCWQWVKVQQTSVYALAMIIC